MAVPARPDVYSDEGQSARPPGSVPLSTPTLDGRWQELILRAGFIATGVLLLSLAFQTWQGRLEVHHALVWIVFLEYALAFGMLAAGVSSLDRMRDLVPLIAVSLLFGFLVWSYATIQITQRTYSTDNITFSQVAAERLMHGQNPYEVQDRTVVEAAADQFGLRRSFITTTTDGQPLDHLISWPAGTVLALVPALALGVGDVRWVVVVFEIATFALLWFKAAAVLRPLAAVPLMADPDLILHFTGGGVMDYLWVAPMLACAIALYDRRFGWAALLYGLAAGIKQQPWLLAPFLLIWVWNARRDEPHLRQVYAVTEFAAVAALGFLALNLPFMVWGFPAWLSGVFRPFNEQLTLFGSGFSLLTQTGIADLPRNFYTASVFGVWGVLVFVYALHFRTIKHTLWIAPAIIMWFAYRSLQSYFVYWTPLLLVALLQWWNEQEQHGVPSEAETPYG